MVIKNKDELKKVNERIGEHCIWTDTTGTKHNAIFLGIKGPSMRVTKLQLENEEKPTHVDAVQVEFESL